MSTWFRQADRRFPFAWETTGQPGGRWHPPGGGPVQYLADTPDGAWAEFLRHEEISDPADLEGIARTVWAVRVDEAAEAPVAPALDPALLTGGPRTWPACRREAARLRAGGARALVAPSAALLPGGAGGERVDGGLVDGPRAEGRVLALFGARPDMAGWRCAEAGRPAARVLAHVRPLHGRAPHPRTPAA